jgi:large subunit ribosomal protein L24
MQNKFHVRKGDTVMVVAGKNKGAKGSIQAVLRKEGKVIIQGVNLVKKHQKPSMATQGGIVEKEAPIAISNVMHIDPVSGKPTRIGYRLSDKGHKVRFAKKSGTEIEKVVV